MCLSDLHLVKEKVPDLGVARVASASLINPISFIT